MSPANSIKRNGIIRQAALYGIIALFGGLGGFLIAAGNGITLDGHDHGADHGTHQSATHHMGIDKQQNHDVQHNASKHAHDTPLELGMSDETPTLSIALHPDPMSGYNLQLIIENFRFSGQNASLDHIEGEGHAHLYIDGVKIARLYGDWTHLAKLPDGAQTMTVSLTSNDHRALTVNGVKLEASLSLSDFH